MESSSSVFMIFFVSNLAQLRNIILSVVQYNLFLHTILSYRVILPL